jgi:hypothetical protein
MSFEDQKGKLWDLLEPPSGTSPGRARVPKLKWKTNKAMPPLPAGVFVGSLPDLSLEDADDPTAPLTLALYDSRGRREVRVDGKSVRITDVLPGYGFIAVERKGVIQPSTAITQLSFTLLPQGTHVFVIDAILGPLDPVYLHCIPAVDWTLSVPQQHTLVRPGVYRFNSGEWTLGVDFRNGSDTLHLDLPVPRVSLRNLCSVENTPDSQVAWSDETDRIVVAGAIEGAVFVDQQPGRAIGGLRLGDGRCTAELDHAAVGQILQEQPIGEVQVRRKDREVFAGLYFGSDQYVEDAIISRVWEFRDGDLPTAFFRWFRIMRDVAECAPTRLDYVRPPRNIRLKELTVKFLAGAREFDEALLDEQNARETQDLDERFSAILEWHRRARGAPKHNKAS